MRFTDLSSLRLQIQQIESPLFSSAKELVSFMGAMQAQDFPMSKWAIGLRTLNSTQESIEAAYNRGDIIRTHLLRPTWHIVSADDIYWIHQLTVPNIRPAFNHSNKRLELTKDIFSKSNRLLENVLTSRNYLTRDELICEYDNIHIKTNENRLSHLLMNAELDGLICSGPLKANKLTYCLLEERVQLKKLLNHEESLAELTKRYFVSHSPATLEDFIWWSGLTITNARKGLEMIKSGLNSEIINDKTYWFSNLTPKRNKNISVHLLPAFDEFLIAYKDRSASISNTKKKTAISENGIFRPVIVINGQIKGLWKRTLKKDKILVETSLFEDHEAKIKLLIENKTRHYIDFQNKTS